MKIIVTRQNDRGVFLEVGMSDRALVSNYKTIKGAIKHFAKPYANGKPYKLEIYFGDSIYGNPDKVIYGQ